MNLNNLCDLLDQENTAEMMSRDFQESVIKMPALQPCLLGTQLPCCKETQTSPFEETTVDIPADSPAEAPASINQET